MVSRIGWAMESETKAVAPRPEQPGAMVSLHLMCVQGGISCGKIPLIKALLKIEEGEHETEEEGAALRRSRQQVLLLLDRQNRNMLHHLVGSLVPSEESFTNVDFLVGIAPLLLFQRDSWERTPLECVLEKILAKHGTRRRRDMSQFGSHESDGLARNHRMLMVLVRSMERATSGEREEDTSQNTLQWACLLPKQYCPYDGSLLTYLSSELASRLESTVRTDDDSTSDNMASKADSNGNRALHLFVSNKSYANDDIAADITENDSVHLKDAGPDTKENNSPQCNITEKIWMELLRSDSGAISIPNEEGQLPLHIAMKCGNRQAVALLVMEYPECVLLDDSMDNMQLFMHILGCISTQYSMIVSNRNNGTNANYTGPVETHQKCLTTMFGLIRARPAIVSLAGRGEPVLESGEGNQDISLKKKWWKKLNPFKQRS